MNLSAFRNGHCYSFVHAHEMKTKKCVRFPSVCLWCWWWALSNHIAEIQNLRYTKSLCGRKNAKIKTHIKNKIKFELEATVVCTYARCACTFLLWWKISSWKKECDFISLMLLKFHYYNANNHTSLWAMNLCAACSPNSHSAKKTFCRSFSMFTTSARKLA